MPKWPKERIPYPTFKLVEIRQNLFAHTLAKLKRGITWFIQCTLYFGMKHCISIHFLYKGLYWFLLYTLVLPVYNCSCCTVYSDSCCIGVQWFWLHCFPSVNTAEFCYVYTGYVYIHTGCFNRKIRSRPQPPSRLSVGWRGMFCWEEGRRGRVKRGFGSMTGPQASHLGLISLVMFLAIIYKTDGPVIGWLHLHKNLLCSIAKPKKCTKHFVLIHLKYEFAAAFVVVLNCLSVLG